MLKVYTTTYFQGHYPVSTAAIIVAESPEQALELLVEKLKQVGLYGGPLGQKKNLNLGLTDLDEVDLEMAQATILNEGDY